MLEQDRTLAHEGDRSVKLMGLPAQQLELLAARPPGQRAWKIAAHQARASGRRQARPGRATERQRHALFRARAARPPHRDCAPHCPARSHARRCRLGRLRPEVLRPAGSHLEWRSSTPTRAAVRRARAASLTQAVGDGVRRESSSPPPRFPRSNVASRRCSANCAGRTACARMPLLRPLPCGRYIGHRHDAPLARAGDSGESARSARGWHRARPRAAAPALRHAGALRPRARRGTLPVFTPRFAR